MSPAHKETMKQKHHTICYSGKETGFPPVETANREGLLAVGGDLSPDRLLSAYNQGIFPWFNEGSRILWWSPDPRMVLFPKKINISKSMLKVMASGRFTLTKNTRFESVLDHCASIWRKGQEGTWITEKMKTAYLHLHREGYARSYEVWEGTALVGGLYGVDLGFVFCGESMFSLKRDASKFAFIHLAWEAQIKGYTFIDCQVYTRHLESLGAERVPRSDFIRMLKEGARQ